MGRKHDLPLLRGEEEMLVVLGDGRTHKQGRWTGERQQNTLGWELGGEGAVQGPGRCRWRDRVSLV